MEQRKLPVFRTVWRAQGFLFRKFFGIIGVAWFALLLIAALDIAIFYVALEDPETSNPSTGIIVLTGGLIQLAFLLALQIGMTKLYFGSPIHSKWFYFSFDSAFWRSLIASIIVMILTSILLFAIAIPTLLAISAVDGISLSDVQQDAQAAMDNLSGVAIGILIAAGIVLFALIFFIGMRFSLILPALVARGGLGLVRSWRLTRGNVWRLFGSMLLVGLSLGVWIGVGFIVATNMGVDLSILIPDADLNDLSFESLWMAEITMFIVYLIFYSVLVGYTASAYKSLAR